MKKLIVLFLLAMLFSGMAVAQKEFNNWFFGNNAGLNFNSGSPSFLPGGNVVSDASSSVMSDSQGNLLFYTDGITVWDKNHHPMPNGTGLLGNTGGSQTVLITYIPGNKDLYYVFTVDKGGGPKGLRCTMINMNLNGGLGDVDVSVIPKNYDFNLPVTEKITAVKNKNGIDLWLIVHSYDTIYDHKAFFVYSIDCKGHFSPKVYTIGSNITSVDNTKGYLKASPDGKKLVSANYAGDFELFDFDNATGIISNFQSLPAFIGNSCSPYGVEFSPDSKLLYVSEASACAFPVPLYAILQYKLDPNISNIISSRYIVDAGNTTLPGALQLGPDNKIYIAYNGANSLGVINNPNVQSVGTGFLKAGVSIAPATSSYGLPNVIAGFKRNTLAEDTTVCDGTALTLKLGLTNSMYHWSTGSTLDSIIVTTTGKYWVDIVSTNENNETCPITDTINVTFQSGPKFNLPNDTIVCQDKLPLLLSPTLPVGTYLWQDSTTKPTYSAIAQGLYWLQVTANGCSARDSVFISAPVGTSFNLGADTSICPGDSLKLKANVTANSYLWSTGSTADTITIKTAGVYWCEVKYANGCSYRDSIKVSLNASPIFSLGNDTILCQNKFPLILSQSVIGASYLWQDSSTLNTFSVPGGGIYWLRVTVGGCSARDSIIIKADSVTTFSLGADTIVCTSSPYVLTVNPAFTSYLWNTGATTKSISISGSGIFWCEATNASGCSYRDSIQVTINTPPVVNLGKDTSLCSNQFPFLIGQTPITGATYLWQDGTTGNTLSVSTAGTYWLQVTLNGCTSRDSIIVYSTAAGLFNLGADTVVCTSNPYALTVIPTFASYLWNTGSTSKSISITTSGIYWCEATTSAGCSSRDSIKVTINVPPTVNVGKDTTLCSNQFPYAINQAAITGASYLWQDGSTGNSLSALTAGTYWLQATVNGCSARDSIIIKSNPVPSFTLGADTVLCTANPYTLTVNAAFTTYLWNTGATSKSININNSGIYWCQVSNATGCNFRDSIQVTINVPPTVNIGRDTTLCSNQFPYLISQATIAGASYLWQDGSTGNSLAVSGAGTYWLQATLNGCSARDSIIIKSNPVPSFTLGADTVLCTANPYTLTVNPAFTTYLWNTGATSKSISITNSGIYWCQVSNATGCSFRDSIRITINNPPVVNLGRDTSLCSSQLPLTLGQSLIAGASYLWQDGTTGNTLSVTSPGTYWLQVTLNGCSSRDSIVVNVITAAAFNLGNDTTICTSGAYVLTVNPAFNNYLWSTGNTSRSINVTTTGLYWCEVSNGAGCRFRDSIRITINRPPVVDLGNDTALCANQFPYLISQVATTGASYLWQDGSTGNTLSASAAGVYWLQVTVNGCSSRDSITINSTSTTSFSLGADTIVCTNKSYILTASAGFSSYLWNNGSTSRSINVTATGLYWCEVSSVGGCGARDSIQVTINTPPAVNLGKDTSLCPNQFPYLLSQALITGASYLWQDGSTSSSLSALSAGTYWLQATLNGCSSRDSIVLNANPVPSFTLGSDTTVCAGNPLILTVNPAFTSYLWNTGSTSKSINVTVNGLYWCEATNSSGCSFRDSIRVTFKPSPVVNIGNDTTVCSNGFPFIIGQVVQGASYLWQDGTTSATYSVTRPGTYSVQVSANGCSSVDSITVTSVTQSTFTLGPDISVCSSQPVTLTASTTASNYLWSTGSTAQSINVNASGDYWCEINRGTGCSFRDTIRVTFSTPIDFTLGRDTVICDNKPLLLDVSNKGDTYTWQDNSKQQQYLVNKSGTYFVTITKGSCVKSDTMVVTYSSAKFPDLGPDKTICPGDEILLDANVLADAYLWQDGTTGRTYKVTAPGTYSVQVQNVCGKNSDEIIISLGSCKLMIPNAFTPGKNPNSTFRVLNARDVKDFDLQLFGRWGQKVFATQKPTEGWDGKYNGAEQPGGTYIYQVSYTDTITGKKVFQKGVFILVR